MWQISLPKRWIEILYDTYFKDIICVNQPNGEDTVISSLRGVSTITTYSCSIYVYDESIRDSMWE